MEELQTFPEEHQRFLAYFALDDVLARASKQSIHAALTPLVAVRVQAAVGEDMGLTESLTDKLVAMWAELVEEESSALERLLAGRIIMCWLRTALIDARLGKPHTLTDLQRGRDCTHRLIRSMIRTLAFVRRAERRTKGSRPRP